MLPLLRNGETAQLHDPKIEDKETRPPPRYNEGTLIEAMQSAWRFVDDEVRERLREAKGIGTPATRAEILGGLKKQGFLIAQGKHIVSTEAGLSLFGVLKKADPALVDPGVTAQLECLLDDVVVGKQEMVGATDTVCNVAERISKRGSFAIPKLPQLLERCRLARADAARDCAIMQCHRVRVANSQDLPPYRSPIGVSSHRSSAVSYLRMKAQLDNGDTRRICTDM